MGPQRSALACGSGQPGSLRQWVCFLDSQPADTSVKAPGNHRATSVLELANYGLWASPGVPPVLVTVFTLPHPLIYILSVAVCALRQPIYVQLLYVTDANTELAAAESG